MLRRNFLKILGMGVAMPTSIPKLLKAEEGKTYHIYKPKEDKVEVTESWTRTYSGIYYMLCKDDEILKSEFYLKDDYPFMTLCQRILKQEEKGKDMDWVWDESI